MDSSLLSKSLAEFADEVSRDTPVPGGGSVSALAGALGAALASMVINLTLRKEPQNQRLAEMVARAQQLKDALLAAVDEDTQAFAAYIEARRLPKSTPEETALRAERIQAGLREAALVPMRTAELSIEVLQLAHDALVHGNPNSMTDAAVGAQMAFAAVRGGVWNVRINLEDIEDPSFCSEMESKCTALMANADRVLEEMALEVDRRLG